MLGMVIKIYAKSVHIERVTNYTKLILCISKFKGGFNSHYVIYCIGLLILLP